MSTVKEIEEKVWKVSEVNGAVKEVIENAFMPFWMAGEIGTLNIHRSGHVYMVMKDERSQIRAAYFNGAAKARAIGLEVGSQIEVRGRLGVYDVRGEYQFNVAEIRLKGLGDLHRRFDELKKKLSVEGLFDESRKKPIPMLPGRIGIVTSPDGAALRDFLQIIGRRFPNIHIRIFPAAVQGRGAELQVARGVAFFNRTSSVDVIIVTRGGGSMEDLWPFNEEALAREIAKSKIPVISAVGHEIDFTICDFVADLRVPTPSAAAELVVGRRDEFENLLADYRRRLRAALDLGIERARTRLERASTSYVFREPLNVLRNYQQNLDDLGRRSLSALKLSAEKNSSRLREVAARLKAINPRAVLERGYAILVEKNSGKIITEPGVPEGTPVDGVLAKGAIPLIVRGK